MIIRWWTIDGSWALKNGPRWASLAAWYVPFETTTWGGMSNFWNMFGTKLRISHMDINQAYPFLILVAWVSSSIKSIDLSHLFSLPTLNAFQFSVKIFLPYYRSQEITLTMTRWNVESASQYTIGQVWDYSPICWPRRHCPSIGFLRPSNCDIEIMRKGVAFHLGWVPTIQRSKQANQTSNHAPISKQGCSDRLLNVSLWTGGRMACHKSRRWILFCALRVWSCIIYLGWFRGYSSGPHHL